MQTPMKLKQISLSIIMALGVTACADMQQVRVVEDDTVTVPIMESVIIPLTAELVE